MFKPNNRPKTFYDAVYDANIPKNHLVRYLQAAIDWSRIKRYLKKHYYERGRDAYNPLMMFKLLVLQFLADLSDRELEEAVRDRISWRWFIGLDPLSNPPDHTAYCRFRDRIGADEMKNLFDDIVEQAREKGLILDGLSVVDATHIVAKVDTFKMRKKSKEMGSDDPTMGSPDPDARYGHKSDKKPFFGYKCHGAMDAKSRLFTKLEASPGHEADTEFFEAVHDERAGGVTGDKGYDGQHNFDVIEEYRQRAAIIPKHLKGRKRGHVSNRYPDRANQQYYRRVRRKRPWIEPKWSEMKNEHGMKKSRYWGLMKNRLQVFITGIVVNLKRLVRLESGIPIWKLAEG